LNAGIAQINTTVGDFAGNADKILHAYRELVKKGADFVVTPEMAVCGYPPMDLVFRSGFIAAAERHVNALAADTGKVPLIVGTVEPNAAQHGRPCRNSAVVLQNGRRVATAHKSLLPTYDVFDEGRYFEPATRVTMADIAGRKTGITICEDLWSAEYLPRDYYGRSPVDELEKAGIGLLLNLSASPFEAGKPSRRRSMLGGIAKDLGVPLVYANLVGGNDQLVFDGHSLVFDRDGSVVAQLAGFREENALVVLPASNPLDIAPDDDVRDVHEALVLGLRDYLAKCGFKQVVMGSSGCDLVGFGLGGEGVLVAWRLVRGMGVEVAARGEMLQAVARIRAACRLLSRDHLVEAQPLRRLDLPQCVRTCIVAAGARGE